MRKGGTTRTRVRKMLRHTPKMDKPRLLFAAIACFLAAKCSVSTKFCSPWIRPWYKGMKLTRLTCVWLYDTTGGKVVAKQQVAAVSGTNERKSFMH